MKRYKLYLASGIRLWTMYFQKAYTPFFNRKVDLFQPALIDKQYTGDHRNIPIRIATKDLGEINACDAILAYMKMYDTQDNGPAGTDSTWECGYAIGKEKPTIMIVEDIQHLDYYSAQWMVTFSIGAILTTDKQVAEQAKNHDKFTHTTILYCDSKAQFEKKIIAYLDQYYKSIYAREGIINYSVDQELRAYSQQSYISGILSKCHTTAFSSFGADAEIFEKQFCALYGQKKFKANTATYQAVCNHEIERARIVQKIIRNDVKDVVPFLQTYIRQAIQSLEGKPSINKVAQMISYWLQIPAEAVKGHKQGRKKTRPAIFFELHDLVSHHVVATDRYFGEHFVYQAGAVLEVYNWLNTYAIDDVFDNSRTRQGQLTLHEKYNSRKNAILLGSIGHCLSLILLHGLTKEKPVVAMSLLRALNDVQFVMYHGQQLDLRLSFSSPKSLQTYLRGHSLHSAMEDYFSRIYGICGSFYEEIGRMAMRSTNVGAQFYNQKAAEDACITIAKYFGLVQMIRNDLGDLLLPEDLSGMSKGMKDTSHNDVMEGKLTLPILYTLLNKRTTSKDRNIFIHLIGKQHLTAKNRKDISRIIWESGAIEYCLQFVAYYAKQVREQYVKHIHETPTRLKWILKLMDVTPLINVTFRRIAITNGWRKLELEPLASEYLLKIEKLTTREAFLAAFSRKRS